MRIFAFLLITLCWVDPSFGANERAQSEFRGVYLGMSVEELARSIRPIGLDAAVRAVAWKQTRSNPDESANISLEAFATKMGNIVQTSRDISWSFIPFSLVANVEYLGPSNSKIDLPLLRLAYANAPDRVLYFPYDCDRCADDISTFILTGEDFRKLFKVTSLTFYPEFFESNGVSINDFAQSLTDNFPFVDNVIFAGANKGKTCTCYIGLLETGEGINVSIQTGGSDFQWKLEVFQPNDDYKALFLKTKPVFQ